MMFTFDLIPPKTNGLLGFTKRVCEDLTNIHTYIHTYIHIYIHAYIHTDKKSQPLVAMVQPLLIISPPKRTL